MTRYSGIHHLAMVTNDMEKTIRFWRDLLGMKMVATFGDSRSRQYFFEISDRDLISFFEWPEAVNPEEKDHGVPTSSPIAFDHVAIGVECDEDLVRIQERLDAAGFLVSGIVDHGFIHSIYSFDPNNIPIEFCCDVRDRNLRGNPLMKDKNPVPAALEGCDPQKMNER